MTTTKGRKKKGWNLDLPKGWVAALQPCRFLSFTSNTTPTRRTSVQKSLNRFAGSTLKRALEVVCVGASGVGVGPSFDSESVLSRTL